MNIERPLDAKYQLKKHDVPVRYVSEIEKKICQKGCKKCHKKQVNFLIKRNKNTDKRLNYVPT